VSDGEKVEVRVNCGENAKDVDHESAQHECCTAASKLARSEAQSTAELKPMQDHRSG
jgi:hypothetical protein